MQALINRSAPVLYYSDRRDANFLSANRMLHERRKSCQSKSTHQRAKNRSCDILAFDSRSIYCCGDLDIPHKKQFLYCRLHPAVQRSQSAFLSVIWLAGLICRIRNIKKTDDPELKTERIRSCRIYGIFVGCLTLLFIAVIVMTVADSRKTHFAELPAKAERSILLEERAYGSRIYVYQKKGIVIRPEDEVKLAIYANTHVIRDAQYTWETDGKTVTVRFETGCLAEGLAWDESSGSPAPPEIIEKVYTLPA